MTAVIATPNRIPDAAKVYRIHTIIFFGSNNRIRRIAKANFGTTISMTLITVATVRYLIAVTLSVAGKSSRSEGLTQHCL